MLCLMFNQLGGTWILVQWLIFDNMVKVIVLLQTLTK